MCCRVCLREPDRFTAKGGDDDPVVMEPEWNARVSTGSGCGTSQVMVAQRENRPIACRWHVSGAGVDGHGILMDTGYTMVGRCAAWLHKTFCPRAGWSRMARIRTPQPCASALRRRTRLTGQHPAELLEEAVDDLAVAPALPDERRQGAAGGQLDRCGALLGVDRGDPRLEALAPGGEAHAGGEPDGPAVRVGRHELVPQALDRLVRGVEDRRVGEGVLRAEGRVLLENRHGHESRVAGPTGCRRPCAGCPAGAVIRVRAAGDDARTGPVAPQP